MLKPGDELVINKIISLSEAIRSLLEYSDSLVTINITLSLFNDIRTAIEGTVSSLDYERNKILQRVLDESKNKI